MLATPPPSAGDSCTSSRYTLRSRSSTSSFAGSATSTLSYTPSQAKLLAQQLEDEGRRRAERGTTRAAMRDWSATGRLRPTSASAHKARSSPFPGHALQVRSAGRLLFTLQVRSSSPRPRQRRSVARNCRRLVRGPPTGRWQVHRSRNASLAAGGSSVAVAAGAQGHVGVLLHAQSAAVHQSLRCHVSMVPQKTTGLTNGRASGGSSGETERMPGQAGLCGRHAVSTLISVLHQQ